MAKKKASQPHPSKKDVVIILSPGFEEIPVAVCISQLREAGISVTLVSMTTGLISSSHGLRIHPDLLLEQLPPEYTPQVLLFLGSSQWMSSLLTDPRIPQFAKKTMQNGGILAAPEATHPILFRTGIFKSVEIINLISLETPPKSVFVDQLINRYLSF